MRPTSVSVTGVGASSPIPVNWRAENFGVSVAVENPSGNTFTVQHTFSDIYNVPQGSWEWHNHDSLAAQTGTRVDGNYAFPVMAVRINVTLGAGVVTLTLIHNN